MVEDFGQWALGFPRDDGVSVDSFGSTTKE